MTNLVENPGVHYQHYDMTGLVCLFRLVETEGRTFFPDPRSCSQWSCDASSAFSSWTPPRPPSRRSPSWYGAVWSICGGRDCDGWHSKENSHLRTLYNCILLYSIERTLYTVSHLPSLGVVTEVGVLLLEPDVDVIQSQLLARRL